MKTVAVVPMKLNNSRLPNKNIKEFTNGKPLCHYILLLSIRDSYEAPFKRITQLLVQVHKLGSVID